MSIALTRFIWHNGRFVPWSEARVHVLAHGLHYGSSVFEGLRSYETPSGTVVFRLRDHVRRLFDSARIYRLEVPYAPEELAEVCRELLRLNELGAAYIRPIVYRGAGTLGLVPGHAAPIEVAIAAVRWDAYLGPSALEQGVDVGVASWSRPGSRCTPLLAKAGGHYLNAQLIAGEAARHGYAEGIALDEAGRLSEGSGENLFLVRDGVLHTPPLADSILSGITRDSVIELAARAGIRCVERSLPRDFLYVADEVFLTGTAVEITPVRSVDGLAVGAGTPGPVTKRVQRAFFGLFSGETPDAWGWLDPIEPAASVRAGEEGARHAAVRH